MNQIRPIFTLVLISILSFATSVVAQEQCPLPPSPFSGERNIFTPQQEMWLGEVMAEQGERDWKLIADDELNARLQRIGEQLLKHLPATDLKYRFLLIDLPEINAFGIPGGRVYVTRKMVAFVKNDDELAALLAHEIGHIYTHQQAIDFSRYFHDVLGVDTVTDREDVRKQFNALLDNQRRKPSTHKRDRGTREQAVADQLGLYAIARAGYSPQVMPDFFDRLTENHGKTGSFLSDLFGATSDDSRRLREMLKTTAAMPKGCIDPKPVQDANTFAQWQQAVVAHSGRHSGESSELASALIRKSVLTPSLQDDFERIRFSPDGNYLLVQDDSGITVLTHHPLKPLYRIPAPDAAQVKFSPDSKMVVFYTTGPRVERWNVAENKRVDVHEVLERRHCLQAELAPDGNTFACLDEEITLRVYDVSTSTVIYEKKQFGQINWFSLFLLAINGEINTTKFISLAFTPDAKVMVAATFTNNVALDIPNRRTFSLPGATKTHLTNLFTFLDSNRMAVVDGAHSGVYEFPSGKLLTSAALGGRTLEAAAHGDYVIIRPLTKSAAGLFDIKQNKLILGTSKVALDEYDGEEASEGKDGKLVLTHQVGGETKVIEQVDLPRGELRKFRTIAVSSDMNWLALSLKDRGAIYDLNSNERSMFLRAFYGAHFISGPAVVAEYPKFGDAPRMIATMNLKERTGAKSRVLEDDLHAFQAGGYLIVRKPGKEGLLFKDVTLEVQGVTTGEVVFSQHFPGLMPATFVHPEASLLVFASGVSEKAENTSARDQIQSQFSWPDAKKSVYELQVVDLISGKKMRDIHIDSGKFSFAIRDIRATREYLDVADSENRVQLYSLQTGQQIGIVFGGPASISPGGTMSVVTSGNKIALYECATLKKLQEFDFASDPVYSHLSDDGKRLLVLTGDQTAYELKTYADQTTASK